MNKPVQAVTPSQGYTMAPSNSAGLWQMLVAMLKMEKTLLDSNAEMQKNWAKALGGTNGIYQQLFNAGVQVGEEEANGLIANAWSQGAQACISGASLVGSGVMYFKTTSPQLNQADEGLKDLTMMKDDLKAGSGGMIGEESDGLEDPDQPGVPKIDKEAQDRINQWANGNVENYGVGGEEQEINQRAARKAANDPNKMKKIQKAVNKREESLQSQKQHADGVFNTRTQYIKTATEALNSTAGSVGSVKQADAQEAKAKAQATQQVIGQVQQAESTALNNSERNAQDNLQQMSQWISSAAQAMGSQVHIQG
jgi:hypothetical protein